MAPTRLSPLRRTAIVLGALALLVPSFSAAMDLRAPDPARPPMPMPAPLFEATLASATPGEVEAALGAVLRSRAAPLVAPEIVDPARSAGFLRDAYDEEAEAFSFSTAHPEADAAAALVIAREIAVARAQENVTEGSERALDSFLRTGKVPAGWTVTAVPREPRASGAPLPAGELEAAGPSVRASDRPSATPVAPASGTNLRFQGSDMQVTRINRTAEWGVINVRLMGNFTHTASGSVNVTAGIEQVPAGQADALESKVEEVFLAGSPQETPEFLLVMNLNSGLDGDEPVVFGEVDPDDKVAESDETDNGFETVFEHVRPQMVTLESKFQGNFLADTPVPVLNEVRSTTEDPQEPIDWQPVDHVIYVHQGPSGVLAVETNDQRGLDHLWKMDIGGNPVGPYAISAQANTSDGALSDPLAWEYWQFDVPDMLSELSLLAESTMGVGDLWAPGSPAVHGRVVNYYGGFEFIFKYDPLGAPHAAPVFDFLNLVSIGVPGVTCMNEWELYVELIVAWDHDVYSDPTLTSVSMAARGTADVLGADLSLSGSGSALWGFSSATGEWSLQQGSFQMSGGTILYCDILEEILARFSPPPVNHLIQAFDLIEGSVTVGTSDQAGVFLSDTADPHHGVRIGLLTYGVDRTLTGVLQTLPITFEAGRTRVSGGASIDIRDDRASGDMDINQFTLFPSGLTYDFQRRDLTLSPYDRPPVQMKWRTEVSVHCYAGGLPVVVNDDWTPQGRNLAQRILDPTACSLNTPSLRTWDDLWDAIRPRTPPVPGLFAALPPPVVLVNDGPMNHTTVSIASDGVGRLTLLHDLDDPVSADPGTWDVGALQRPGLRGSPWTSGPDAFQTGWAEGFARIAKAPAGQAVAASEVLEATLLPGEGSRDHPGSWRVQAAFSTAPPAWTPPATIPRQLAGSQSAPRAAMSPDGNVALVAFLEAESDDLLAAKMPRVALFQDGVLLRVDDVDVPGRYADAPTPIILPGGAAALAWSRLEGDANATLFVSGTADVLAAGWSPPFDVDRGRARPASPRFAADAGGLTLAWVRLVNDTNSIVERTVPLGLAATGDPTPFAGDPRIVAGFPRCSFSTLARAVDAGECIPEGRPDPVHVRHFDLEPDGTGSRFYVWIDDLFHQGDVRLIRDEGSRVHGDPPPRVDFLDAALEAASDATDEGARAANEALEEVFGNDMVELPDDPFGPLTPLPPEAREVLDGAARAVDVLVPGRPTLDPPRLDEAYEGLADEARGEWRSALRTALPPVTILYGDHRSVDATYDPANRVLAVAASAYLGPGLPMTVTFVEVESEGTGP